MDIDDDERYMYDDGRFEDDGEYDREDDFDIPTYDELDLEGRYYTYGSRSEYNEWRYYKIQELKEERLKEQRTRQLKKSNKPNEHNNIAIPPFDKLSDDAKACYASRNEYEEWRNKIMRKRRHNRTVDKVESVIALIIFIAAFYFFLYVIS